MAAVKTSIYLKERNNVMLQYPKASPPLSLLCSTNCHWCGVLPYRRDNNPFFPSLRHYIPCSLNVALISFETQEFRIYLIVLNFSQLQLQRRSHHNYDNSMFSMLVLFFLVEVSGSHQCQQNIDHFI